MDAQIEKIVIDLFVTKTVADISRILSINPSEVERVLKDNSDLQDKHRQEMDKRRGKV